MNRVLVELGNGTAEIIGDQDSGSKMDTPEDQDSFFPYEEQRGGKSEQLKHSSGQKKTQKEAQEISRIEENYLHGKLKAITAYFESTEVRES